VVKHQFADYTGHIDKFPGVEMVNDEARCFLTSSGRKFDVVQASLIDTFAATAGGGLALTENSLYTADGWKPFISHLTDTEYSASPILTQRKTLLWPTGYAAWPAKP
jgi:hypothetical protein